MKILVSGGAGFIGSNVADAFIAAGHRVAIVDNLTTGKQENLNPKAEFFPVDIRDARLAEVINEFAPDAVAHLAAQIDVRKSVSDPVFSAGRPTSASRQVWREPSAGIALLRPER